MIRVLGFRAILRVMVKGLAFGGGGGGAKVKVKGLGFRG